MEIAGLVVGVQPLFQSTREYCRPYLTDKQPEFFVCVAGEDLIFQQMLLEQEAMEEGLKIRKFTEPFLERATIQRKVADELIKRNTLMLHGSTVAVDGRAYLFTAPCGTGKSTHTRLWRELFGDRAIMVNDDMPFLQITSNGVLAYGSPWSGKHGLDTNITVPLKGVCILDRGTENRIVSISPEEALPVLLKQSAPPEDAAKLPRFRTLVAALACSARLWRLHCTKDQEAAQVAFHAMSR